MLLDDKDVFIRYMMQWMANRLTQFKSASNDAEQALLEKIRRGANCDDTNKLSRMFNEYKMSNDLSKEFNETMRRRNISFGYDFNALTLSKSIWPLRLQTDFNMPPLVRNNPTFTLRS